MKRKSTTETARRKKTDIPSRGKTAGKRKTTAYTHQWAGTQIDRKKTGRDEGTMSMLVLTLTQCVSYVVKFYFSPRRNNDLALLPKLSKKNCTVY